MRIFESISFPFCSFLIHFAEDVSAPTLNFLPHDSSVSGPNHFLPLARLASGSTPTSTLCARTRGSRSSSPAGSSPALRSDAKPRHFPQAISEKVPTGNYVGSHSLLGITKIPGRLSAFLSVPGAARRGGLGRVLDTVIQVHLAGSLEAMC